MRFEIKSRLIRVLVEVTFGPAAPTPSPATCRVASRVEHQIRRDLWRRTVKAIKSPDYLEEG